MSVTIAMIGAGAIGERHVEAAVNTETKVAYVVDQDLQRASQLAATCGAKPTQTIEDVWGDSAVDAVIVGVPNWLHKPLAVAALEAGKDVLLEKPMGLNLSECEEINRVARQAGKLVQVGLVHRYTGVVSESRAMVANGDLGNVYHVKTQMYRRRGVPGLGGWFTTKAKSGGGAMIDIGVHLLDIGMHVTGFQQATEVSGQVYSIFGKRMRDYVYEEMWAGPPHFDGVCDVDDSACALIRFEHGMTLELNVTWAGNFSEEVLPESMIMLLGETAGVSFELSGDHILMAKESAGKNIEQRIGVSGPDLFSAQMTDFARAVQDRRVGGATGAEATEIQRLIDAIYESSDSGSAVNLRGK